MITRILHVSDLHVNLAERAYLEVIADAFVKDVRKFCDSGKSPDVVCITGDIINGGENADVEFPLAEELFLTPLANATGISRDEFFFVPGNHEVNWKQLSPSFETGLETQLKDKYSFESFQKDLGSENPDFKYLANKIAGYEKHIRSVRNPHEVASDFFFTANRLKTAQGLEVGIVGFNTAWRSSKFGKDDKRLIIGEPSVMAAYRKIANCQLKVCLCHHPFEMLTEWDQDSSRRKIMKYFNVLLNGHVHDSFGVLGSSLLGNLFISTAGSLRPRDPFTSYSLLEVEGSGRRVTSHYRRWYGEIREEFGPDEEKASEGKAVFTMPSVEDDSLAIHDCVTECRSALQLRGTDKDMVCPLEDIESVSLQSVFVEPLIFDSPAVERNIEGRKTLALRELIDLPDNLVFYGRAEYGKTTVLRYVREHMLSNYREFGDKVPVMLRFSEISPKNPEQIFRVVAREFDGVSENKFRQLAEKGKLVLLVDDYDDRNDVDRAKKTKTLRAFHQKYTSCRYILGATEAIGPHARLDLISAATDFEAKSCYIGSLNTARIRQLIQKWGEIRKCDVEGVLKQVLYYFQHLQLPPTPLATTLFIGVLFRKRRDRNIRNEAYLIENYFETLLQKLNPTTHDEELEFKEKEAFLAHIAVTMVRKQRFEWELNEFERCKLDYFDHHDENVPDARFFEAFFKKGILSRDGGLIGFKRRSWFNFFLAKALENDPVVEAEILELPDVTRYGKSLAYKAGLKRNDHALLDWVDKKMLEQIEPLSSRFSSFELRSDGIHSSMQEISERVVEEIREKNTEGEVDQNRDEIYLTTTESTTNETIDKDDQVDLFAELITVHSSIVRNTTQIPTSSKRRFITNSIKAYIALMWGMLEAIGHFYKETSEEQLIELFFRGRKDATTKQKLKYVIEYTKKVIHSFAPLSVMLYMSDHLGNPKMVRSYEALFAASASSTDRLFIAVLCFSQEPSLGLKMFHQIFSKESSASEDFLIFGFMSCYCRENTLPPVQIEKVVNLIDLIRRKYAKSVKGENQIGYVKDDFRSSLTREFLTVPKAVGRD